MHAAQVINHDLAKAGLYNAKLVEIDLPVQVAGVAQRWRDDLARRGAGRCRCQARRCEVMQVI